MNRNSALVWLDAIKEAGVQYPRTVIFPYDHRAIVPILDEGEPSEYWNLLVDRIARFCERVNKYPLFLRTDLGSAKHSGPAGYLITSKESVGQVLLNLLEDQEMKFFMTEDEGPMALIIREFLDLDSDFTAFNGLPIAREWRMFVDGDHMICAHPYWPAAALEGQHMPDNWQDVLADHHTPPECLSELAEKAMKVAKILGGSWSADFAMDKQGKWWLTDMATAADSFHWEGCQNA